MLYDDMEAEKKKIHLNFTLMYSQPYLRRGGGGGGHKVPALISKICIFAANTAIATKFGDFS